MNFKLCLLLIWVRNNGICSKTGDESRVYGYRPKTKVQFLRFNCRETWSSLKFSNSVQNVVLLYNLTSVVINFYLIYFFILKKKASNTTLAISLDSSCVFTSVSLHASVIGLAFIYNKRKYTFSFNLIIVLCVLPTYFFCYYTFYNFVTNVVTKNFTQTHTH